jgi:CRP-like cAMP-binding protein
MDTGMNLLPDLLRFDVFSHLGESHLEQVAECTSSRYCSKGEALFDEADTSSDIYLVESGEIVVSTQTPLGSFALARMHEGALLGEASFIDLRSRAGAAEATLDTELLVFDPECLRRLTSTNTALELAVYWAFWKSLSEKLRASNRRLSRFFLAEAGNDETVRDEPSDGGAGESRLDLAAKRGVFQEQKLSAMEINFLASLSRELRFAPGQTIFREGDPGDTMYIVVEGQVMISKHIPGAGEEALDFLGRGTYVGEMALIDKRSRSADAKAHDPDGAVVLEVPRDVVEGILDIHKVSSIRLLKILCLLTTKRLRDINEKLVGWYVLTGGDVSPEGTMM